MKLKVKQSEGNEQEHLKRTECHAESEKAMNLTLMYLELYQGTCVCTLKKNAFIHKENISQLFFTFENKTILGFHQLSKETGQILANIIR